MKKIITFLVCTAVVSSTFAQTTSEESRRVILGNKRGSTSGKDNRNRDIVLGRDGRNNDGNRNTRYPSGTYGSGQQQVDQVNREYDNKIQSIRNNPTLSGAEKERMIRQLEKERSQRIRAINGRSQNGNGNRNRRYDRGQGHDNDDDDNDHQKDKKYKNNNGNQYGWEKGKGNKNKHGNAKREKDDD